MEGDQEPAAGRVNTVVVVEEYMNDRGYSGEEQRRLQEQQELVLAEKRVQPQHPQLPQR